MSENRLSNLAKDLIKAKQQALLIEVLKGDLDSWAGESTDPFRTVCGASAAVFDTQTQQGKTNVLVLGEDESQGPLSVFGALLGSLESEISGLQKRELLGKLAGLGLSQALGGTLGEAVGESLSIGADKMMDYFADWMGSAADYMGAGAETVVEITADQTGDWLETAGEAGSSGITGQFSSADKLYLTRPARKRLEELAPRLKGEATSHEILQLALEMLLATAQGSPKVIVLKDPLRLDAPSLALLAMLVSLEKDLRQITSAEELDQGGARTAGISVVLAFTGLQPHDTPAQKDVAEKQQAISRLRMMASRYSLLERLDSDIPVPAVRASTFVGREEELECLGQDWAALCEPTDASASKQTWCLIKGEPGTGKTALANRFIQLIRSDAHNPARLAIPHLRMLNQTGHGAQATGLASLKSSMLEELRRLSLLYKEKVNWLSRAREDASEASQSWLKDARSDDAEAQARTLGRIGKLMSKLAGVELAVEAARSAKALGERGEMLSMNEQSFGESSHANHKEEQFELLQEALQKISELALQCTPQNQQQVAVRQAPMLLLIDDLQWVDDVTAEFLLNEWPATIPVYIVATARGSDSFTTTGESDTHRAINQNRNRLFSELKLIKAAPANSEPEHQSNLSAASQLNLAGMDQPMLANLIKLTYANITLAQAEHCAAGVIRNLSVENSSSQVITLFAVETLNVISDPQFYQRNPGLLQLIERVPNTQRYRFRIPEETTLEKALDSVFSKLKEAYEASYMAQAKLGDESGRFNLASFAVLEERLHLIEQYFGEYGGSARYSLLFSALLGSPFQSELIQHVIEDLKQLPQHENPELAPFLKELQAQARASFNPEQYELLERAYEIIRRLEEDLTANNKYVHQHGLLQQFLRGQFTQLIDRVYPELPALKQGIRALVKQIETAGEEWFETQSTKRNDGPSGDEALRVEKWRFLLALRALLSSTNDWNNLRAW